MSTYEILTIILTVFSGLIAVSAIIVPVILNYLTKRAENKRNSPKELDKLQYNEYRLKYMKLVDDLSLSFSNYLVSQIRDNKAAFISNIYKLKVVSDYLLKSELDELLDEVQSDVFDKNKLIALFNIYLEDIGEQNLYNYWYGGNWTEAHNNLINDNDKRNSRKKK